MTPTVPIAAVTEGLPAGPLAVTRSVQNKGMEALAVIALVLGLAAAIGGGLRSRARATQRSPVTVAAGRAVDEAEIDVLFAQTSHDFDAAMLALLTARLRPVVLRGVPVHAVRPAPAPRTARVLFADGTVVIARGYRPGDLGQLSVGVLTQPPVCLVSYSRENDVTRLEFVISPDRRLSAVAVGIDQAD